MLDFYERKSDKPEIISIFIVLQTHRSELPSRTGRCPTFLALRSDDMSVHILLVRDFLLRLGSKVCGTVVFQIVCREIITNWVSR